MSLYITQWFTTICSLSYPGAHLAFCTSSRLSLAFCDILSRSSPHPATMQSSSRTTMSKSRVSCPNAHQMHTDNCLTCAHHVRTNFLHELLPISCCGKCALHAFLQTPASFGVAYVWWFHVRLGQSASVQERSVVVQYHELSSSPCLRFRRNSADHVSYVCHWWCSCEVGVGPVVHDFCLPAVQLI